jgi:hypothetical protein
LAIRVVETNQAYLKIAKGANAAGDVGIFVSGASRKALTEDKGHMVERMAQGMQRAMTVSGVSDADMKIYNDGLATLGYTRGAKGQLEHSGTINLQAAHGNTAVRAEL